MQKVIDSSDISNIVLLLLGSIPLLNLEIGFNVHVQLLLQVSTQIQNFLHLTEDRLDISNNWTWLSELLHWFSNIC